MPFYLERAELLLRWGNSSRIGNGTGFYESGCECAAAVIASSSVKSARRSSATGDAARKLRHQQIEEAESAASASADEQYAEIAALSLERDAVQAACQSAEKTYGATQIKYQSGAINKATYLQGEASYLQKKQN